MAMSTRCLKIPGSSPKTLQSMIKHNESGSVGCAQWCVDEKLFHIPLERVALIKMRKSRESKSRERNIFQEKTFEFSPRTGEKLVVFGPKPHLCARRRVGFYCLRHYKASGKKYFRLSKKSFFSFFPPPPCSVFFFPFFGVFRFSPVHPFSARSKNIIIREVEEEEASGEIPPTRKTLTLSISLCLGFHSIICYSCCPSAARWKY